MDGLENLCTECASIDPVGILLHGESLPPNFTFTLTNGGDCPFCSLCARALNSTRAAAGKPPLEGQFEVTVDVKGRWGYSAVGRPDCDVNWLKVLVVEDSSVASQHGSLLHAAPDSIHIQIIRNADSCISDEDCYLSGRRVFDDIDLRLVNFWMSQCIGKHEGCESLQRRSDLPEYLIDTSTLMLVSGVSHCQYAALSYVWGDSQVPQLKLKDLKELEPDKNTWSIGGHWTEVPQTIKDAILLCQLLSIQYLWVDALCILHDRPSQSALCDTHISQQMCSIYGSAHLTIVAAAGNDSWAGLPGIRTGTRSVKQHTVRLDDVVLANVLISPRDIMASSTWNTRAWTFQESMLSNRLLIFTEEHCFWSCNSPDSTFCEDIHREIGVEAYNYYDHDCTFFDIRDTKQHLLSCIGLNRYEHYQTYLEIVEDYTGRNLTYQQDALEAFSGIAHFLSREISTSFLWGIPLRFFEQALLFRPHVDTQGLLIRRREFPSWSWVGWYPENGDGKGIQSDSWVGTRRNIEWSLGDFRSINTWYRFVQIIREDEVEFQVVEGIENSLECGMGPSHRTYVMPPSIQPLHVLLFDAMTARLDVRGHELDPDTNQAAHRFSVYIPGKDRLLGTLMLDVGWNKSQSHQFVAIAQETREVEVLKWNDPRPTELKDVIHTLLVETNDKGISERRHMFTLDKVEWDEARPERQTMLLV